MLDHGRYIHRWEGWPRMAAVTQYLIRPYIDTSLQLSRGLLDTFGTVGQSLRRWCIA